MKCKVPLSHYSEKYIKPVTFGNFLAKNISKLLHEDYLLSQSRSLMKNSEFLEPSKSMFSLFCQIPKMTGDMAKKLIHPEVILHYIRYFLRYRHNTFFGDSLLHFEHFLFLLCILLKCSFRTNWTSKVQPMISQER